MIPFNSLFRKIPENNGSKQRDVEIPFRWRVLLFVLFTYIVICIVVIFYLASGIYSTPPRPNSSTPEESSVVLFQPKDSKAGKSDQSYGHKASVNLPTKTNRMDINGPQWFGLDLI